jgi:CRISPR-associated protein Cmr5
MGKTTLDQRRAANALGQVRELHDSGRKVGHYVSYVKSLPASILQNGLGSALATLLAAAKGDANDPHRLLYDHLNQWICSGTPDAVYPDDSDALEAITRRDEKAYLHAQAESLAYLDWLKKFAVAKLTAPEGSR